MLYIGRHKTGVAIIYDTREQATQEQGSSYLEVESLPPGDGILMTDLKTLWWEGVPPKPENPITLEELQKENKMLKAQLQAQVDRSDFIEDCIAEMATVVYGGV